MTKIETGTRTSLSGAIRKTWTVDDKTFSTWAEARSYISNNKPKLLRDSLVETLRKLIQEAPYGQAEESSADDIADGILARYDLKPRK
jgi:hypothetical protein